MKIRLLNLLLIGGVVSAVMLSSCKKESDNDSSDDKTIEKGSFTDTRDHKTYKWVKIGNQVWMAENLAYTGSDIKHKQGVTEWMNTNAGYNGWCYYNNDTANGAKYGVLYQWEAAKKACPSGWHLPTQAEWKQLISYLTDNGYSYDGYNGVSDIAKSIATSTGWKASNTEGAVGNSDYPKVQNKTGFSALPAGRRDEDGTFKWLTTDAFWWTSSEFATPSAYYHTINNVQPYETYSNANEGCGFSVRCVKD